LDKQYDFIWEIEDETLIEENKEIANELISLGYIKDVYLLDGKVIIEYTFDCKNSFIFTILNKEEVVKKIKAPLKIKDLSKFKCKNQEECNCTFDSCIIIIAAYIFYKNRKNSYYNNILEDVDIWDNFDDEIEEENNEHVLLTEDNILDIFTEDDINEHKDLIDIINNNELLSLKMRREFFVLIKNLINYKALSETINLKRPNYNYAIIENTDTVNDICLGQWECIEILKLIFNKFECIKNDKIKHVNFRELSFNDSLLKDENYEADIIILSNIHYLTNKNLLRGSEESQENALIIKNNISSFILKHQHDKIFIMCDKNVNIKEFFTKNQQLSFQFRMLKIPDLKYSQVGDILLKKLRKNELIKLDEHFERDLDKYLQINYTYAPYKNLEFVDFVYNDALKNLITDSTDLILNIKHLPVFRNEAIDEFTDLENMVGLHSVKKTVSDLKSYLEFKKDKERSGDEMPDIVLHMAFYGNPGTGKTTVARLMAGILFDLEFIRYNKCIECESKDLIANVPGETAMKTSEKIQEAMGGILFIDEAYAIGESPYGSECIATLIKAMEDYRHDLIVIIAGYKTEMLRFLEINSGFLSRISYQLEFNDYSNAELVEMTKNLFAKYNVYTENYEVTNLLEKIFENEKRRTQKNFGNSRFVRNTVDKILSAHAINVEKEGNDEKKLRIITVDDIKLD